MSSMKLAVIVPVYNEARILPAFLAHYCPQVERVFVLDNESTDATASIADSFKNVERTIFKTGDTLNDRIQHEAMMQKRLECIGRFDYVLLVDADEFVHPKGGGRIDAELMRQPTHDIYGTHGYCMVQGRDEGSYDPAAPLFAQRRTGREDRENGSKPIIVRPDAEIWYGVGRHKTARLGRGKFIEWFRPAIDRATSPFFLLHFAGLDEETFVNRRLSRIRRLSKENRENDMGAHYFAGDEGTLRAEFAEWRDDSRLEKVDIIPL